MGCLRCQMPGCKIKGGSGFHKFPRDFETCKKWQRISNLRYLDTAKLPFSSYRLCKKHFKTNDYIRSCNRSGQLKKGAMPSLFIPKGGLVYAEHNYVPLELELPQTNFLQSEDVHGDQQQNPEIPNFSNHLDGNVQPSIMQNEKQSENKKERKEVENLRRRLRYSKARISFLQKKLKVSTNLRKEKVVQYLSSKFSEKQMTFLLMQLKNSECKNHGQRYSNEEKCMLLALYRHGAKSYRFLSGLFSLPSKRTLNRHSALLKFTAGINPKLFHFMKLKASQLNELDKYCTIVWDEMALTSHLSFCETVDAMDGFVDLGDIQIPEFATHALVFMVRGINQAYKQPVAYFFVDSLHSVRLAELIRLVISEVLKTGMKVIGSVCDQTQTNAAAVGQLTFPNLKRVIQNGQVFSYIVEGNHIVHCFDPPHILKVIRNNLHAKNLTHFISDVWDYKKTSPMQFGNVEKAKASWDHVRKFYHDFKNTNRLLRKITDEHIDPEKLKMKVHVAAQVFSNTFGSIMMYCYKNNLPEDFSGTAHFLMFVNDLFDSLNSAGKSTINPLRSAINVNNKAKLFLFWDYAIAMLEKMNFVDKEEGNVNNSSSVLKKTISTIKGYMELTNRCLTLGMKSVSLRRMNQDGLENFFGQVKAACYAKKQPMPFQFRTAFTNLIVTGLTSKHSMKSNCQDDKCSALLQDVYDFYDMDIKDENEEVDDDENIIDLDIDLEDMYFDLNICETEASAYESGNVCRKVLARTNCESCINTLEAYCPLAQHGIIQKCDNGRNTNSFTYPTVLFMDKFKMLSNKIGILLPLICHEKNLSKKLTSSVSSCTLQGLGCKEHCDDVSLEIKAATAKDTIPKFMKSVNGILAKKIVNSLKNQNCIEEKAFKIVKNKKGVGKHGQKPI